MPSVFRPRVITLGLLLLGCGTPGGHSSRAAPDSPAGTPPAASQARSPVDSVPVVRPSPAPRESRRAVNGGEYGNNATANGGEGPVEPGSSLDRECVAHRASGSGGTAGEARFVMAPGDARFQPRSAALTRRVTCAFRGGNLFRATEAFYLRLVSMDRENPGFTTGAPGMSERYYLVCEGGLSTTLPTFVAGQVLSFADNTFTLPCGHLIYPTGVDDPARAERVTGVYSYKVQSATLQVRQGATVARPGFDVAVDVVVVNPIETLQLRGRVSGRLGMTFTIVDCPTEHKFTKEATRPGCE